MACNEIHKDDIGTEFMVTVQQCINNVETPLDISSSTVREIVFKKPDGTTLTKTASYTSVSSGGAGDGTDGKISYFTISGDLDSVGTYKIQGIVTTPLGKWYSTIDSFKVKSNL